MLITRAYKTHHHYYYYCCSSCIRGALLVAAAAAASSSSSSNLKLLHLSGKSPAAVSYCTTSSLFSAKRTHLVGLVKDKCKSRSLNQVEALWYFNSMIRISQPPISIFIFNLLFTGLYKMKDYDTVVYMCRQIMGCTEIKPTPSTLNILVKSYCLLNRVDLGFSVLSFMVKCGIRPTSRTMNPLLYCAQNNNSSLSALLKSTTAPFPTTRSIDTPVALGSGIDGTKSQTHLLSLVQEKCKSRSLNLDEALEFFNSMIQLPKPPICILTFNQLFATLYKMKHYTTVVFMCKEIFGCPKIKPDEVTLNILINCYCYLNQVSLGFSVLSIFLKCRIQPTPVTMIPLLRGLCTENKMAEAIWLFNSIVDECYLCDELAYNIIIDGLCKNGNAKGALEILRKMVEKGQCRPDTVTYTTIISGLCKERRIDVALNLFKKDMMDAGVAPTLIIYNSLIHCLCELCMWTEATQLLHEMHDTGIYPDLVTFNSIVGAVCKAGRKSEALRIFFQAMASSGLKPDVVTYTSLIQKFSHLGRPAQATELSELTFNALIDALCKGRRVEEAHSMVEETVQKTPKPDFLISVVEGLCHLDKWKEISFLFKEMLDQGIYPNSMTLNILLDGLCKDGMTEKAYELLKVMIRLGIKPDNLNYNTVIGGHCLLREMEKAYEVLNMMIEGGIKPNTITYNTLIGGHCLLHEMDKSMNIFDYMISKGCAPDAVTYNTLISGYVKIARFNEAQRLVQEMIQKGFRPNAANHNIVEAYCCKGQG